MALNFCQPDPQVTFQYELDTLQFHLVNVHIEAVIRVILALLIDILLKIADQSQYTLYQAELVRQ